MLGGQTPGTGFIPIKPDVTGFGSELEAGLDREGGPATDRASRKMQQVMAGVFAGGAALVGKSVFDFAGFDKQMREVFTLLPGITAPAMDAMSGQVKDFAAEFGVLPTEVVPALYQALSSGIPSGNVFDFLETSQKLARGGVTDLETAVGGLASVVNAYGSDVLSASAASDIMFTTVTAGTTTIGELSDSLFQVAPIAAGLGVDFEDVSAALAQLTLTGTPTSVAANSIKAALAELGKEGSAASDTFLMLAGKTFPQFIADGGSLTGALWAMKDASDESGVSVRNMFGSIEAGQAFDTLTSDMSAMNRMTDRLGNTAGATDEAFETMNVGLAATMDRLKAKFSIVLIDIGEAIAPTFESIGLAVGGVLELFSKLPGPMQAAILLFATLTAGVFAFARPILAGITLFSKLGGVFSLLAANPWILVLAGLVAVTFLIIEHWEEVKAVLEDVWGWMQETGQALATFFVDLWNGATELVREAFDSLTQFFVDYWPYLLGIFTGGLGLIVGLVIQNWDAIWTKVEEVTGAIVGAVSTAWNTVYSVTTTIGGTVVDWIVGIPTKIAAAFTTLAEIIAAPFRLAFDAVKSAWNATLGGFGFTVPGWIPELGGKAFTIPSMALGGVLTSPTLLLAGDTGRGDPEIVTPQSIMRDTVVDALNATRGAGGVVVNLNFVVDAGVTDPRFFEEQAVEMARVVQRELERQRRAEGDSSRGIAA